MFATIEDLYIRFGKANVIRTANFDSLDELDPETESAVAERLEYFLQQAYELICDSFRQGSYDPDEFEPPYPQTLVNLNCETAYIALYRTRHSHDETVPDAFQMLINANDALLRNIQGGAVRFAKQIPKAFSLPANVDTSLNTYNTNQNICSIHFLQNR